MKGLLVSMVLFVLYTSTTKAMREYSQLLVEQLSASSLDFSQRLYQQVALGKDNVIYSPYSIHSALSMTSSGARGNTLTEMRTVLGESTLGGYTSNAYHEVIAQLNSADMVKLHTANALFVQPEQQLNSAFVDEVTWKYFADVMNIDVQAWEGPERAINDFVAKKTEHMIKKVVAPGSIDSRTLMLLVNTIFFNGTWQEPFEPYQTRKQDFHQRGFKTKQVDMMYGEQWQRYKRDYVRKADILEMPFRGNRFSLNILLPHDKEGVYDVEKTLTTNGVGDIFQDLIMTYIGIKIPKFRIETSLSLKSPLAAMGMEKAFSQAADFSGMTNEGNLYIDQVVHQAVIEVEETGTVAGAATVSRVAVTSARWTPRTSFIADHPFLFFLRDSQTGQVLFQGKFSG